MDRHLADVGRKKITIKECAECFAAQQELDELKKNSWKCDVENILAIVGVLSIGYMVY